MKTINHFGRIACISIPLLFSASAMAQNLLTNGSFESATNEFTTDYSNPSSSSSPQGQTYLAATYCVATSPKICNQNLVDFKDHTSGTGKMLNVNGSNNSAISNVWKKTVAVSPNMAYEFSAWIASGGLNWNTPAVDPSPARIKVFINDIQVGVPFTAPAQNGKWVQFSYLWSSNSATSATIRIVDDNLAYDGNDFSLDDLNFSKTTKQAFSGTAVGVKSLGITCKNTKTGQTIVLPQQASPNWNCMAAGLNANSGDGVQIIISGPFN